ncbi:MAG: hypothetical protein Q7J68_03065 [Thermoplasmata archaeon]|nr:hypothetical protein [Thermoplasmata archaeon]
MAYWAIEMNELGTNVLKVMESSSLGRMSIYVLTKQSEVLGIDMENISPEDVTKLANRFKSVLPFFLGEETDEVLVQIRRVTNSISAVTT